MKIEKEQIRYLGDVQRLVLGPNDTLVLTAKYPITAEMAEYLRDYLQKVFGPEQRIVVLSDELKLGVLAAA